MTRFVYAASNSTYSDHPDFPKVEDEIGNPLSPYTVTKLVNELYAAVIPKWGASSLDNESIFINDDVRHLQTGISKHKIY